MKFKKLSMKVIIKINSIGWKIIKTYNDSDQLVKEQDYGKYLYYFRFIFPPFNTTIYIYDDLGLLISTQYYWFKKVEWTKFHQYNDKGKRVKEITSSSKGKDYLYFIYNEQGHCIGNRGELSNGHKYGNSWEVDNDGNKIPMSNEHSSYIRD